MFTEAGWVCRRRRREYSHPPPAGVDYDVSAAERGIVYIDEIDKIARKGDNPSITRDAQAKAWTN